MSKKVKVQKDMPKSSKVWSHFGEIYKFGKNGRTQCLHCKREYSFTGGCVSNLKRHLLAKHPEVSKLIEEQEDPAGDMIAESIHDNQTADRNMDEDVHLINEDSDPLSQISKKIQLCKKISNHTRRVWQYFKPIQDGGAQSHCNLCNGKIMGWNTTDLIRHLENKHDIGDKRRTANEKVVWSYYRACAGKGIQCKLCSSFIRLHGNTTANLKKHLVQKHKDVDSGRICNQNATNSPEQKQQNTQFEEIILDSDEECQNYQQDEENDDKIYTEEILEEEISPHQTDSYAEITATNISNDNISDVVMSSSARDIEDESRIFGKLVETQMRSFDAESRNLFKQSILEAILKFTAHSHKTKIQDCK